MLRLRHVLAVSIAALAAPAAHGQRDPLGLAGFTPSAHRETGPEATGDDAPAVAARRSRRGVWPIANGRVFGYTGLGDPANRLMMITGPHYQTRRNHEPLGAFGECWIELRRGSKALRSSTRSWRGAARAAAASTEEVFAGGLALRVVDVALAGSATLLRRVELTGPRAAALRLEVRFSDGPNGTAVADGPLLRKSYARDEHRRYRMAAFLLGQPAGAEVLGDRIAVTCPAGDAPVRVELAIVTSFDVDGERAEIARLQTADPAALVAAALAAPRAALRGTLTAEPAGAIRSTIEAVKTLVLAQRSLPGGAVAPMVSFKGVWLRDSNGPLKTFLWTGQHGAARALLRYYRRASALRRATHREFPLDLPVDDAPALAEAEWSATGTDRCEVPSFVVLQHLWYWHATGDATLIREHYAWLRRNALHQVRAAGPHGPVQPFNGDETYLHGAFYSLFPQRGVWPNEFPRASAYSLDSMLTYVACQRAMVELCVAAGRPEHVGRHRALADEMAASVESHFWMEDRGHWAPALSPTSWRPHPAPYAPINLAPLWLGTHASDEPRAVRNLQAVIALLGRDDGLCRMTPSVAHYIGSLPGYYLANLAAVDHPLAWRCLPAVLGSRSPSGEWVEVHAPDRPGHGYGDGRHANRLRPWESGLCLDGVLRFLTGAEWSRGVAIRLRPRLPEGVELRRLGPIAVGATRIELRYPASPEDNVTAVHVSGPACRVNGERLAPRVDVAIACAQPADLPVPAPRRFRYRAPAVRGCSRLVVTTSRRPARRGECRLDAGMPFRPEDLAAMLLDGDEPRIAHLVLEPSALRADRDTMKPARFWTDPALTRSMRRFVAAGGRVSRGHALTDWWIAGPFPNPDSRGLQREVRPVGEPFDADMVFGHRDGEARWWRRSADASGRLDLHPPAGAQDRICCFARTVLRREAPERVTLRFGTDDGCRVWLNGALVFESIEHRHLDPDRFELDLTLGSGVNVLVIGVEDRTGGFALQAAVLGPG